ncbi:MULTISPECIES: cache domain-containing sensor histidine kinase [Paenibacillus]|uniref:Sensor histidine kinase n=1 Tax=Paenibacillus residui TaxID=629724 RepID=A0ABW3D8Y9_9BACL|nr:sensor histidine kinase [Paenibacillus sp. 32O-W]
MRKIIERLKRRFRNARLESKVFIMTSIVIVLAVPLTGMFSYSQAARILERYAYNAADQTVSQLSGYMNNELKNISDKLYWMNASDEMKTALYWADGKLDVNGWVVFNEMFALFSQTRLASPTIRSIYMYTPKGEFYEGLPYERKAASFKDTPYYKAIRNESTNQWVYAEEDPLFAGRGEVISLVTRPVLDISYLEQDNYLVITLSANRFMANLRNINLVPEGFSLIMDETGKPILMSSPELAEPFLESIQAEEFQLNPGSFEWKVGRQEFLVSHQPVPFAGWNAVLVQPKDELLKEINYIKYFTFMLTGILLILSFVFIRWIARWVMNPLRKLQRLMNRAKDGNLNVRFESEYEDEIGQLGNRFDDMIRQIQQLLKQVVEESQAKRQAEMRALQAQINPHFLYNTLDEIYWKTLDAPDSSASEIILSLSRFFRLSLNQGEEMTTVAKEMEHVEQYLKLVNVQYRRQFSYVIQTDDRTKPFRMPKIILQPLVENSVLHAFNANDYNDYRITVSSEWIEPRRVRLRVEDNGSGIKPEWVTRFNEPLSGKNQAFPETPSAANGEVTPAGEDKEPPRQGYAIANVRERLWYAFGERASFRVESTLGEGTVIEITMEATEMET